MRISDWSSDVCSSDLASTSFARSTADRSMLRTEGRLQGRAQHRPQRAQPRLRLAVFRRRYRRIDPPIVEQGQRDRIAAGRQRIDIPLPIVGDDDPGVAASADGGQQQLEHDALVLSGDEHTRSEAHTSELQSLMRNTYAVFCLKKKHSRTP